MYIYICRWYRECKLEEYGLSRRSLLLAYFLATANTFEAEMESERFAWAKTTALIHTIASHFHNEDTSMDHRTAFVKQFTNSTNMRDFVIARYTLNSPSLIL